MGFFVKNNGRGQSDKLRIGRIAGLGISTIFGAAALISSAYVNEAREISLEVRFGNVTKVVTEPGLKFKVPFITSRYPYSLARQTTRIGNSTTLRTSDDVRLANPFTIEYQIDQVIDETAVDATADLKNLYFQLKGTGEDIEDVIQKLAADVGVRVFEGLQVTDLAEEGITDRITKGIKARLQADLTVKGWPVTVIDVLSDGFRLSPESESVLERIIDIRQEKARLALRMDNAIQAEEVMRKEAQAYVAYAEELSKAGLPKEDIRCAIYDKMAADSGRIMEPFAQVCTRVGDDNGIAIAVDPRKTPAVNAVGAGPKP